MVGSPNVHFNWRTGNTAAADVSMRYGGINERGLAVLRMTPSGLQAISPAPKAFAGAT